MNKKVLVLSPSFAQYSDAPISILETAGHEVVWHTKNHPAQSADLVDKFDGIGAVIVGLDNINSVVVEAAAEAGVKVFAKHGVGVDNIDVESCHKHGIKVINAPGCNSNAVAELVFTLFLALNRSVVEAHQTTTQGEWNKYFGPELNEKSLGIIGFGRIGQSVARIAHGFGMQVSAYDPFVTDEAFEQANVTRKELLEVITQSDYVTLHLPAVGDGPILGSTEIDSLKDGVYVVNTARGKLIDDSAMARALSEGKVVGYGADAHTHEPLSVNPYAGMKNVILTPHIGAFTDRANNLMGTTITTDITRVLSGNEPENEVK